MPAAGPALYGLLEGAPSTSGNSAAGPHPGNSAQVGPAVGREWARGDSVTPEVTRPAVGELFEARRRLDSLAADRWSIR